MKAGDLLICTNVTTPTLFHNSMPSRLPIIDGLYTLLYVYEISADYDRLVIKELDHSYWYPSTWFQRLGDDPSEEPEDL